MRPIDADALLKAIKTDIMGGLNYERYIREAPTLELPEKQIPKGKYLITDAYPHKVYCSECFKTFAQTNWEIWKDGSLPRNFCPNCGADLRGTEDEE